MDRAIGNRDRESATLGVLGIGYYELSKFDRAIEILEEGLPLWRELSPDRSI